MTNTSCYDVVVVGCGHAGLEAALAAARLGSDVLVVTKALDAVGHISCNPSVGGVGKSQLVKEVDALGGAMGRIAELCSIHRKTLNTTKGSAVQSTRLQVDRLHYMQLANNMLTESSNITTLQDTVVRLKFGQVLIVCTALGLQFRAKAVVIATGTYLSAQHYMGSNRYSQLQCLDPLAQDLTAHGLKRLRFKTGTPPRLDGRTIDWTELEEQTSDLTALPLSFTTVRTLHTKQTSCWVAHTNQTTHAIIATNAHASPVFQGTVLGEGPRYCMSIEEKVLRFPHKTSHTLFIEPEGLTTNEMYLNGLSTCLPALLQRSVVQSICGLKTAEITRFGYAVEYDAFDPRALKTSLESKHINGLYFAGQVNGTTGYEEAAAQGIVAGINAANLARNTEQWQPDENTSYIGVLISDLTNFGVSEPYRMFTSRAAHNTSLRETNADLRLTPIGRKLGVVLDAQWAMFCTKKSILESYNIRKFLHRKLSITTTMTDLVVQVMNQIRTDALITTTINKQLTIDHYVLPPCIDYQLIRGLTTEAANRLNMIRPRTIGQAKKLEGLTAVALATLLAHTKPT